MKAQQLAPNQIVINADNKKVFQSYESIIAVIHDNGKIELDQKFWDYSQTTGKYRNKFLGETKKETLSKINSGEYKLTNLN